MSSEFVGEFDIRFIPDINDVKGGTTTALEVGSYFYGYSYHFLIYGTNQEITYRIILNEPIKITNLIHSLIDRIKLIGGDKDVYIPGVPLFPLIFQDIPVGQYKLRDALSKQDLMGSVSFVKDGDFIVGTSYTIHNDVMLSIIYEGGIPVKINGDIIDPYGYAESLWNGTVNFNGPNVSSIDFVLDERDANFCDIERKGNSSRGKVIFGYLWDKTHGEIYIDDFNIADVGKHHPTNLIENATFEDNYGVHHQYFSANHQLEGPEFEEISIDYANVAELELEKWHRDGIELTGIDDYVDVMKNEIDKIREYIPTREIINIILDYARYGSKYKSYLLDMIKKFPKFKNDINRVLSTLYQ